MEEQGGERGEGEGEEENGGSERDEEGEEGRGEASRNTKHRLHFFPALTVPELLMRLLTTRLATPFETKPVGIEVTWVAAYTW